MINVNTDLFMTTLVLILWMINEKQGSFYDQTVMNPMNENANPDLFMTRLLWILWMINVNTDLFMTRHLWILWMINVNTDLFMTRQLWILWMINVNTDLFMTRLLWILLMINVKGKCKIFYGQEPPSGESSTTSRMCGQLSTTWSNLLK